MDFQLRFTIYDLRGISERRRSRGILKVARVRMEGMVVRALGNQNLYPKKGQGINKTPVKIYRVLGILWVAFVLYSITGTIRMWQAINSLQSSESRDFSFVYYVAGFYFLLDVLGILAAVFLIRNGATWARCFLVLYSLLLATASVVNLVRLGHFSLFYDGVYDLFYFASIVLLSVPRRYVGASLVKK